MVSAVHFQKVRTSRWLFFENWPLININSPLKPPVLSTKCHEGTYSRLRNRRRPYVYLSYIFFPGPISLLSREKYFFAQYVSTNSRQCLCLIFLTNFPGQCLFPVLRLLQSLEYLVWHLWSFWMGLYILT